MSIVARTYRGALRDLEHHGRIVVSDTAGKVLYHYGDPYAVTFARSGAKPMQAIAVCESGALDAYEITDQELAIMCASHNGESGHVALVEQILRKAGLDSSYLLCGNEYPIFQGSKWEMICRGLTPDPLHCDCSGKHAGMLLTAKFYGEDLTCYPSPDSPTQRRINEILCHVCDCKLEDLIFAVDGCGVPVHALPMVKLAQGYARMSKPELLGERRGKAVRRITQAMTSYPYEVAGTGRLCTCLMRAFGERLFSKSGAGSFYGIGLKDRGIGIVVKLEDGCSEFMPGVVMKVLTDLGVISQQEQDKLKECWDPDIYNHHNQIVGRKEIDFTLVSNGIEQECV